MDYMRRARKRRNLSQKQLAELVNVSVSLISLLENGKRLPGVDLAKRLGSVLGFRWTRFYDDIA